MASRSVSKNPPYRCLYSTTSSDSGVSSFDDVVFQLSRMRIPLGAVGHASGLLASPPLGVLEAVRDRIVGSGTTFPAKSQALRRSRRSTAVTLMLPDRAPHNGAFQKEYVTMNITRTAKIRLASVAAVAAVGIGGAGLLSQTASAATTPAVVATVAPAIVPAAAAVPTPAATPTAGTDTSNSDPTHEAGESAAQEATETAGGGPGNGGHSNTDPAHEASESAARQAEEAASDANVGSSTTGAATTTAG